MKLLGPLSMLWIYTTIVFVPSCAQVMASVSLSPAGVAVQYSLTTSTSLVFPTATQSSQDALKFLTSQWSIFNGRISWGETDIAFVNDPFPNNPIPSSNTTASGPVLQITYPAGSYSGGTGGAQWYTQWNTSDGSTFNSMLLSYELAFDSNFNWVRGGKLPGLRGGPNANSCSGGSQPTGNDCFSTRLMWRTGGAGEVYGYMLRPNNLCSQGNIICNSDYGISIDRGSFYFATGQWMRITMLVQMNDPPDVANGNLLLYLDDTPIISQQGLQFRSGTSVNIGGIYFSTFFGGSDNSWATPQTVNTYYRNLRLYGSSLSSNLTGQEVSSTVARPISLTSTVFLAVFVIFALHLNWHST
ncbi:polysaccharide lyase family 14 protein [Pisolithus marmoratus]|nr:polysaccharide lyase family 14 protein [Pisolithus marmoratus]